MERYDTGKILIAMIVLAFVVGLCIGTVFGRSMLNTKHTEEIVKLGFGYYTNDVNGVMVFKYKPNCE